MRIEIRERIRPYSHTPGMACLLPGTSLKLQIYPALITIEDLVTAHKEEVTLELDQPMTDFVIIQDLEKGVICVQGNHKTGFVRYLIKMVEKIEFFFEKLPEQGIRILFQSKTRTFVAGETFSISFPQVKAFQKPTLMQLSLGNHKKQDWDLIQRREDLTEIAPIWNHLSQWTPQTKIESSSGIFLLLKHLKEQIDQQKIEPLEQALINIFKAGFEGILVPQLFDPKHQGIIPTTPTEVCQTPLPVLTEGAKLIKSLLFHQEKERIAILPLLPISWHAGRLTQITIDEGIIDLEWSKKKIRRLKFHPTQECQILFIFKHIHTFRFRKGHKDRGSRYHSETLLSFEQNVDYYFDNFQ